VLGFGSVAEFPLAEFGTPPPPLSVVLPALAVGQLSAPVLALQAGRLVDLPAAGLEFAVTAIATRSGRLASLPPVALLLQQLTPAAAFGRSVGLPAVAIELSYGTLIARIGRSFNLASTFTVESDAGALAEGALAEFALGEGPPTITTYERPVRLLLGFSTLALQAGRNVDLTKVTITLNASVPEVSARRRKLRIHAIAS
jgi:hypothetical protein